MKDLILSKTNFSKNVGKQWHNLSPVAGISGKVVDEMAEI